MLDPLQFYCWVLCNRMKTRFRMVMIAHPGPGIGFHKRFMWQIIIPPTMSFFPDQHFSIPVTPSPLLCALGHSGTTLGLPSILEALATTSHPPAEFPFWVTPSICTAPPWVAHSDKSSHRHTICWGVVGLAWALGGFC